ncbi:MAG: MFS transporter [Thermoleophilia bacterium]|nr:MFS transporter [Thermoleophilia bacterium]
MRRVPLLAAGLVLTGFNLRIAVASVPPLLDDLERDPGMSSTVAGLLTSLPVLCFGLLAPAAPPLGRRAGGETTLLLALLAVGGGVLARAAGSVGALFAGTAAAGAGIAVGNVIVPAVIKGRFPGRVGLLMGLYTGVLGAGAALAGGLAVPAEDALGMRGALAVWAAPAAVALLVVAGAARAGEHGGGVRGGAGDLRTLLRDPLAWQLTFFFGLQSAVFYSGLTWLPSILRDGGFGAATAGALLSVYALAGIPASLAAPVLAARARDQRTIAVVSVAPEAVALAGLLAAPGAAPLWVTLYALGQGAAFSLALTLIVLRSPSARRGAELSGMVQAIGYCVAALGPLVVGALHDAEGGWTAPLLLLLVCCAPMAAAGLGAGRARLVSPGRPAERAAGSG